MAACKTPIAYGPRWSVRILVLYPLACSGVSKSFIKRKLAKKMEKLMNLWNCIIDEYGESVVCNAGKGIDIDILMIGEGVSTVSEVFAELVEFVIVELSEIDEKKSRRVLDKAEISDGVVKDILGF